AGLAGGAEAPTGRIWLWGALLYAWFYLSFSAWSDVAIGVGALCGRRVQENFAYPWAAIDPADFWRRWHISLGLWLRDYVYIPLVGNRRHRGANVLAPFGVSAAWPRPDHAVSHGVARWHLVEKEGPLLRAPLPRRICRLALRPRARGRSGGSGEWRRPPGVRGAALAVVCAALAACGGSRTTPPKVVLIGIDGAEPSVLDRLRAAGRAPVLSRLIATGAAGSLAT